MFALVAPLYPPAARSRAAAPVDAETIRAQLEALIVCVVER
jgi:hypothetical protein